MGETMKVVKFLAMACVIVGMAVQAWAQGYPLGPEDVLEISVWRDEALTRQVIVRPDGFISFPLIGDIVASGRTVDQLRAAIQDKIAEFVPDTPVSVVLMQIGSAKVYVVGKVNRPGMYVMGHTMTVTQALALAGGLNAFADDDSIQILRAVDGKQQALVFDYGQVASGKDLESNIVLQPHDTIVVP